MSKISLALFIFLVACSASKSQYLESQDPQITKPNPAHTDPPSSNPDLKICSALDFNSVKWPTELKVSEWTYYALALNITGSFEGHQGWKNITGNSDGQGLSLGLLQQNLGQGSLQPWLIEMARFESGTLLAHFTNQDLQSLKTMLETWQNSPITTADIKTDEELFPLVVHNKLEAVDEKSAPIIGKNSNSVDWARQNISDSRGRIIPRWKKSFQDMAATIPYRSYQLAASLEIFLKAKAYFEAFNFKELRSLLFCFDVVVQNGGFGLEHLAIYQSWLRLHPNTNEQTKLLALLDARLSTLGQYKQDVKERKKAIILGSGKVHGETRNFGKEFCFDPHTIAQ
jgi:hypothetical protein